MVGFLHGQRTPRLQGQEGGTGRDGPSRPSRPSGVEEVCYIQLPRVDEGDAAAQQAIHHTQTGHPKVTLQCSMASLRVWPSASAVCVPPSLNALQMSASASSDQVPLLQGDEPGLMEPQLPDVTDELTKAPRRLEQVPLVGAPAADDDETTKALRDSIMKAIDEENADDLQEALADLSPEQVEKVLLTGEWKWIVGDVHAYYWEHQTRSAIHYAAVNCSRVEVFEVLLHNWLHGRHWLKIDVLLTLVDNVNNTLRWDKRFPHQTPIHYAAVKGSLRVVEKFVQWGGKHVLEARNRLGSTPLHEAANYGQGDVAAVMLEKNPQLLKIKDNDGDTPLDVAVTENPKVVVAMVVVAGDVVMELLERGVKVEKVQAQGLKEVVPFAKKFLKDRSKWLGLVSLCCCAVFRKLMKMRPKDALTDDFENISNWQEALTANFSSDTSETVFEESLGCKESEWFALLESSEALTVVTQGQTLPNILRKVAFVLLHIESIKGDSGMMMAWVWPSVWLWGAVLTGTGFILLEIFQFIRLKAAYWAD
ncbi:unnamed protein product [Vitrella brassicaformis CCMP3155]|uniref:Uncharacterized protein n=1 Tax=Vitrella brassicaformis (strain CCMP3155) TaxID=1169540 RepID=A0A0G4EDX5_VITBC|nr:unnamed protein product [Vitrella brassicaformis CCMP3155]|eukprot:CEL94175.1 unnamed protein product [Vitrella brassicaformis CCMP3155]